jgi:phospholipase D1/2
VLDGYDLLVSEFAYSLRIDLFREHSGCTDDAMLIDPFSPEFEQVWDEVAYQNTEMYRQVFRCYPDDNL